MSNQYLIDESDQKNVRLLMSQRVYFKNALSKQNKMVPFFMLKMMSY
jgi:hypothetical protein